MKTNKIASSRRRYRKVHDLCGGVVTLFTPPNPLYHPYERCTKCHRPVVDYNIKRVLIRKASSNNGQASRTKTNH